MASLSKCCKRSVLRPFFRFWRRGMACFVAVMALASVALYFCPREYVSEAKVLVRLGRENMGVDPTASTSEFVALESNREAEMNSVIHSLSSRSNIEKVLDIVGADADLSVPLEREQALRSLSRQISVSSPRNSTVIVLSCLAEDPTRAQHVVKSLLDVSLEEHLRVNRTAGSYTFFDDQAKLLKSELDRALAELRDVKNRYSLVTLEGKRQGLQEQLNAVELRQQQTEADLVAAEAGMAKMAEGLNGLSPQLVRQLVGGTPNDGLEGMRQRLYELQTREAQLRSRKSEDHPEVIAIREEVRDAQRIFESEVPQQQQAAKALANADEANAASLRARLVSLAAQHRQLKSELSELNDQALHVIELERRIELLDANYKTYAKGLEQARIDEELKNGGISNLSVIQAPSFVPKAVSPKKALTLVLAFIAACGSGIGMMLLSEHMDESVRDMSSAEHRLGIRVFSSLPYVESVVQRPAKVAGNEVGAEC